MIIKKKELPQHIQLGKAKALDSVVLAGGTRLYKKSRVKFWIERQGALENYYIVHSEKVYHLTSYEFKNRFKVIIKSGAIKLPLPDEDPSSDQTPALDT